MRVLPPIHDVRKRTILLALLLPGVAVSFCASCGGGDDEDASVLLLDLDHDELAATCEDLNDEFADPQALAGACKNWAATTAGVLWNDGPPGSEPLDPAACEAAIPSCPIARSPRLCLLPFALSTSCDATLADLRACYERARDAQRADALLDCGALSLRAVRNRTVRETPAHLRDGPCARVGGCFVPPPQAMPDRGDLPEP